ncbi:hypothetical protein JCM3770_004722 [Rhodotorula araucariae]
MPPRKKAPTAPSALLPVPNDAHPCATLLSDALTSLPARPHPPSYHTFLTSPFYPPPASPPPPSKRKRAAAPAIPPAHEGALEADVVQRKVLRWFDGVKGARGMPWRKEVDPASLSEDERTQRGYEVWVSEIMLQQTRVETVIPYWRKWMDKFPTVKDLAEADIEEVNNVWQGLGYYSRAKRLLDGARTVMNDHDGVLPSTADGLLTIEGIGPYSAGAISSIAFGRRSAMVDGNVIRVLSRLSALHAPDKAKTTTTFLWALADVLVPPQPKRRNRGADGQASVLDDVGGLNKPGAWNQGLMELGATVCTPKNPNCTECPLGDVCLAYAEARYVAHRPRVTALIIPGEPDIEDLCELCTPLPYESTADAHKHSVEVYPMAKEKTKKREEDTAVCVVEWVPTADAPGDEERKVLLVKRPEKGLLAGLYEFPAVDLPPATASTPASRTAHLTTLLPTLLDLPSSLFSTSPSPSPADSSAPRTVLRAALPPVTQIYSHITRTYHAERLVLSSPSPPTLLPAPAGEPEDGEGATLSQSLPGRAKWVAAADVPTANIGGAVAKVWDERGRAVRGDGAPRARREKGNGGKGQRAPTKKSAEVEKGQGTLMGFFARKEGKEDGPGSAALKEARREKAEREASDDDDVIVVRQTEISAVTTTGKTAMAKARVEETRVYKKRRIAPSSDGDD